MAAQSKISDPQSTNRLQTGLVIGSNCRWVIGGICVFLAVATWMVFGQTVHHEFVNFDDDVYVYANPVVKNGLTLNGMLLAFTHSHAGNWHPLTTLSHMLDWQFYGPKAAGHHLTNVMLHAMTAMLLFLVLRQMTGSLWPSAFVAAVFAVHPLRVESVAWVAERKDVLSGLFFMLTLGAYIRYVRHPGSRASYLMVVFLYALGLMCKVMLVTMPFILLLLDYWPLRRFAQPPPGRFSIPRRLIAEKIPLLVLAAVACVVTFRLQRAAILPTEAISLPSRISNGIVSCAAYLGQLVRPTGLAVFYPYPTKGLPFWEIIVACLLLLGISAGAFLWRQKRPYFLVGWTWYLVMLAPVAGLIQVGSQARADRYTYLPQVGLCLLFTWTLAELSTSWRCRRWLLPAIGAAIIVALGASARNQTTYWHDSESLWTHTLACTVENATAHNNLGTALRAKGRLNEATAQYRQALEIQPDYDLAQNNLGIALSESGQQDEAIVHYERALELRPDFAAAQNNLANTLARKGQSDQAIAHFQKALEIQPDLAEAHRNLGTVLLQQGKTDPAITHLHKALELQSDDPVTHNNLGTALVRTGQLDEAIAQFQTALKIKPGYVEARNNLGRIAWTLATCPDASMRNAARAIELAQQANRFSGGRDPEILQALAAAYAEAGRFSEAIAAAQSALPLAVARNSTALAAALQKQLKSYQNGSPFRDTKGP